MSTKPSLWDDSVLGNSRTADEAEAKIKAGADVNEDQEGNTPLHISAVNGAIECVKVLIKHGANLQARDRQGKTPLDLATEYGLTEMVELLSEHADDG